MLFESIILPSITIKIGGKVKKAIDAYRQKKVPMRVMLTDYLAVKSKADLLAEAENPWAYNYKGIEGHEVESGVSHEETLFRFSAMEIKNQEPSDVIEAAFYANKKRNDSAFELGYLLPLFMKTIKETDRILIVNPSPRMVSTIEESGHKGDRCYAVTDETVAKLYNIQFKDAHFCTYNSLHGVENVDAVLITNRDQKKGPDSIMRCLSCCKDNAIVIGLIPCVWFDNSSSGACSIIRANDFSIKQLLVVDPKATASTPRKKMIMVMERGKDDAVIIAFKSSYDERTRAFSVAEEPIEINADLYLRSNKTIIACLKSIHEHEEKAAKYSRAEEYRFSDEISLFYNLYSERKNRYAGVAYYREIKDANLKTWGKKCSPDIEKGLRSNTKEGVISSLENLVYYDSLYPIIRADIKKKYIETSQFISLKGLWFYCWNYISEAKSYDHEHLAHLFSITEISRLLPQVQTGKEMLYSVAVALGVDVDDIPYRTIMQIDLILKTAAEHKILAYDPLDSLVADYTRRASERQQDVRNALVKKHFSSIEENRIFYAIVKPKRIDGKREFSCTWDSLLLAAAIRLFTGMALRETAALKWGDFVQIGGTDDYQFKIRKYVDAKGRIYHHSEKGNWNRFRIVPSAKVLSLLLNKRKSFLLKNGVDKEYLEDCPIIITGDDLEKMREGKVIKHCKPEKISAVCNEMIQKAGIPENEVVLPDDRNDMVTDFNRYHGDIFLSNFRHKANHEAFLTMGEINYIIGISAPDTYSSHYADYSNDFQQIGIIQKLCRWECCYEHGATVNKQSKPSCGTLKGSGEIEIGPFKEGVATVDLLIEVPENTDVKVTAYSVHGIDAVKTEY